MFSRTVLACYALSATSFAAIVPCDFRIRNVRVAPDGFERSVVSVNGLVPGTLITARKGDTLRINVTNELTDATMRRATTISNYCQFQTGTASEDGPAFVTQCPISQFNSYVYNIPLDQQTGTFWYHSHLSSQYVDGLRGPLIILDPQDPQKNLYDVDDATTVVTLEDWYHTPAPTLQAQFLSTTNTALAAPVPDSALINGKGRYVNGTAVARAVINVKKGKRYRLRVINMSAIGSYTFSIEGHSLTIIEADGVAHQPLVVDSFDIYAGQRYSVIVNANQTVANYWIRAPMTVAGAGSNANLDPTNVFAILRYSGAPNAEPTTEQGTAIGARAFVEGDLHPLINLALGRSTINGIPAFTFNNVRYQSPSLPTLLKIMANNATTDADFSTSEHTITLPMNKTINWRLRVARTILFICSMFVRQPILGFFNPSPLHFSGHVFDVVQSLGGSLNYVNPPRRDVVRVSAPGVITDNPGPWFVHCHIDSCYCTGLALVFAEGPEQMRTGAQQVQPAPGWDQLCPKYAALPADLQ
ncbi:Multicopper oxidase [Ceratobasidium sp. AG-Ba]|nr:Multicopper oxidase [Ceratobasidium sp. AG-Ba]